MATIRSNIPVAFSNLYINQFWDSEAEQKIQGDYKEIFTIANSKRSFEEDAGITGFGYAPVKDEGAPYDYDAATQTYLTRYQMITYALGFQVTQEAQEDNEAINMVNTFMPLLKDSMYTTVNQVSANVLNNGFTQSTLTGDGTTLFSNAHPTRAGNQSNIPATPSDLSYTSAQDMITQIKQTKDDRGKPAPLNAQKLVVPVPLWNVATSILQTAGAPGNANNDTNVLLAYGGLFPGGFCENNYLTSSVSWYIKTDARNGLKFFNRVPISLEDVPQIVSAAGDIAVRARVRFAAGASDWRGIYGNVGV